MGLNLAFKELNPMWQFNPGQRMNAYHTGQYEARKLLPRLHIVWNVAVLGWLVFGFEPLRSRCTYALKTRPLCPKICYQLSGALFIVKVPDDPRT
jgi:hypothetical protein